MSSNPDIPIFILPIKIYKQEERVKNHSYSFEEWRGDNIYNMFGRPFFRQINNIYLLTQYQPFKSKFIILKQQYEEHFSRKIFKMIMNSKDSDIIQNENQTILKISTEIRSMDIAFRYEYPVNEINGHSIICKEAKVSPINVYLRAEVIESKDNLHLELFLCEFFQNQNQISYYRVVLDGLDGQTHYLVQNELAYSFEGIKIRKSTKDQSVFYLMIGLYQENSGGVKEWLDCSYSQPLFVAEDSNIMLLNSKAPVLRFLDQFGIENVSPNRRLRVFSTIEEEATSLEDRFKTRLPKLLNLLYLAYKYNHVCELYFRKDPIDVPQISESVCQLNKDVNLSPKKLSWFMSVINILIAVKSHFLSGDSIGGLENLRCNYLNPNANIVFLILNPLSKVRFIMNEGFTKQLCIINGEDYDLSLHRRLDPANIKAVYRFYLNTLKSINKYMLFKSKFSSGQLERSESESQDNNQIREEDEESSESSQELESKLRITRGQMKIHPELNHIYEQAQELQTDRPKQFLRKKKVYLTDMKRLVQNSKKETLKGKKRDKQRFWKPKDITNKAESEIKKPEISIQLPHESASKVSKKDFSISNAYQITYNYNDKNSTTTLEINNSLFISNKPTSRECKHPCPYFFQHRTHGIPRYNQQTRYDILHQRDYDGSIDRYSLYSQPDYSRMLNRSYSREDTPLRYLERMPCEKKLEREEQRQFMGDKQFYMRSNIEKQKMKHNK